MRSLRSVVAAIAIIISSFTWAPAPPIQASQEGVRAAQGIGIYPSTIEWNDVVRGSEYFSDVVVLNGQDVDMDLAIAVGSIYLTENGQQVGEPHDDWISILPPNDRSREIETVTAPSRSEGRVVLRAKIPQDAANGIYTGTVLFRGQRPIPNSGITGSGATVSLGVASDVKLVVKGTQRLSGAVADMYVTDTEASYPLRLTTVFHNTGNVAARPQIDLTIKNTAGTRIGQVQFADWTFDPGESRSVSGNWDTTGMADGEYLASVKVTLGGSSIYDRDFGFNILPRGTITRQGFFEELKLVEAPQVGTVGKATASFYNTGRIDTRTKFVGELYQGTTRLDVITSEEKLVPYGETNDLEMFIRVPEAGSYTLRGKVNFEGKETESRQIDFTVGAGSTTPFDSRHVIAVLIALSVLAAGAFVVTRRRPTRPAPRPRRTEVRA